ncbi:hypothetical protein H7J87_15375 [Mycolicibacterium wolinskyi]|uniref:Uncharacterized protein n=1 Tax=Mycolicibacterium wolinskyi TaxID=59750 RepID=A0A1X2F829_9MYCO|nr:MULTISPECIES: hypothetical protein [Mycolicibacterium]MCV7286708.1 hypothetical protein [Mycolicibacterium wolinskyi]MCV7293688.1 hypothetical protein [Mycolicibacterium goodii]ORX14592.1 hypothetical protein AWC31_25760 [Mycolicibacterium wolinskyi]
MSIDTGLAIVGLVCSVLFAPPTLNSAVFHFNRTKAAKLLRLRRDGGVCVIATTAIPKAEKDNGGLVGVKRDLVPEGDVLAIAPAIAMLSHFFRRKEILLYTSDHIHTRLNKDMIVLGSPAANRYSARFFEDNSFCERGHFLVDVPHGTITCGSVDVVREFNVKPRPSGIPERDFFFIATAPGPYDHHRAWVIGGLTTYGTAAAATILFEELLRWPKSYARDARQALLANRGIVFGECELNHDGILTHWKLHSSYSRQ